MEAITKMKITLKRKLQLKSAIVYLELNTEVFHEEIKEYLNSNIVFSNDIVGKGVRNYLCAKGIFNKQNQLTIPDGIKAKETGMVKEEEEGKYQIWYTQNDPLFENRIFFFKRIKPEKRVKLDPLELNSLGETFRSLPIQAKPEIQGKPGKDAQDSIEFSIKDTVRKYQGEMIEKDTNISCTWIWNNTQNSKFEFSGKFETIITNRDDKPPDIDIDIIDRNKHIDFNIDLKLHIPTIIPKWNDKNRRWPIKIEYIKKDDTYNDFEYSGEQIRDGYDSCVFDELPVEPYNDEEAIQWRDKIINMKLEKIYMHPDDFEEEVNAINQKEGFSAYPRLGIPDIKHHIEKLEPSKKSDRRSAYWHLAAPLDLNVDIPQSLQIDSGSFDISAEVDKNISFRNLAAKFGVVRAEKIFYYDKFVFKEYQQRYVSVFLNCFGISDTDICIITNKTKDSNFGKYFATNKPEITVTDITEVYKNSKDIKPHDRYIIFKSNDNLDIWLCTNSIDFIRFNRDEEITPDTSGTISITSVTYKKVKPDLLGTQLREFIKGINK